VFGYIAKIINAEWRHCGRTSSRKPHLGQADQAFRSGMASAAIS